jgi:hypothetical protein
LGHDRPVEFLENRPGLGAEAVQPTRASGPGSGEFGGRLRNHVYSLNPKSEYRNPKQIQITKKENPKRITGLF